MADTFSVFVVGWESDAVSSKFPLELSDHCPQQQQNRGHNFSPTHPPSASFLIDNEAVVVRLAIFYLRDCVICAQILRK